MAIKAGQLLHLGNDQFVIDRIQSVGANVNIPRDRIYELGNYNTLGNIRDIPDLGFTVDSYDTSNELLSLLCGHDPANVKRYDGVTLTNPSATVDYVNPADLKPFDLVSPFKAKQTLATSGESSTVRGVALPFLFLESLGIRFGVAALTSFNYNLRGDGIYYVPGTPYVQYTAAVATTTAHTFQLPPAAGGGAATAIEYTEAGVATFALSVTEVRSDGTTRRLNRGVDYTDTASGITLVTTPNAGGTNSAVMTTSKLRMVFGSTAASTYEEAATSVDYPAGAKVSTANENIHAAAGGANPAALRGRFVEVYVGQTEVATPKPRKFTRVQDASVNWRVNLERDEEFNNNKIVDMSYNDVPEVTGSMSVKANDPQELFDKVAQACKTVAGKITGPIYDASVPLEFKLKHPTTGKTILDVYIPKASFDVPGYEGRVQTKNMTTFNWYSEDGIMEVYSGDRPGSL